MYPELKSTKPFTQQIHLLHQLTKNKERYANLSDYFVWEEASYKTILVSDLVNMAMHNTFLMLRFTENY